VAPPVNQFTPDKRVPVTLSLGYGHSEGEMLSPCPDKVNKVGNTERNTLNNSGVMAMIPGQNERDVVLSLKIEADSSRVLYALSIPEYIEAWLQTPDAGLQSVFNLVAQESFRIDLYRAAALQASVYGSCCVMSANQVRYNWKRMSPISTTETLVDIQLFCGPGACILGLRHSGFIDTAESTWCDNMWHRSLESLCRLMEKRQTWGATLTSSNRKTTHA
jgi:hypothetical protein